MRKQQLDILLQHTVVPLDPSDTDGRYSPVGYRDFVGQQETLLTQAPKIASGEAAQTQVVTHLTLGRVRGIRKFPIFTIKTRRISRMQFCRVQEMLEMEVMAPQIRTIPILNLHSSMLNVRMKILTILRMNMSPLRLTIIRITPIS